MWTSARWKERLLGGLTTELFGYHIIASDHRISYLIISYHHVTGSCGRSYEAYEQLNISIVILNLGKCKVVARGKFM